MINKTFNKKIKLLYIVEAMGGGVFTYIVDLANQLVNEYDIYIGYAVRAQTPSNFKEYFEKRIHLINVKSFTRSMNLEKDSKAFFEIKKIAKDINPDIIHLHSSKAGALGRFAFNGHKVLLFYTPHGYSFLMSNYGVVKRTVYRGVEMIAAWRYCTTISCSEGEYQETLKLTKRATYVDNGINTKELQYKIDSVGVIKQHRFTVFTLGRICYQKNPFLFNQIAEAMPDIRFIWIGDGELREQLTAPNIEVTGWVDREKALEKALNGDVFVLPSRWEGLPISLLEAMYMKKLCVVSDVIGNHDVIHNGDNGFVCHSVSDFVHGIQHFGNDIAKNMVDCAYLDIQNKYNTKVMAEKYDYIYKGSVSKSRL